jgi:hypothetical protein
VIDEFKSNKDKESSEDKSTKSEMPLAVPDTASPDSKTQNTGEDKKRTRDFFKPAYKWTRFKAWPWITSKFPGANFWTALATVAIAAATGVYVHYARKQWQAMSGQLTTMNNQLCEMKKQSTLMNQQLEGTMGAVIEPTPSGQHIADSDHLEIKISFGNTGHVIAHRVEATFTLTKIGLPKGDVIGEPKAWNIDIGEFPPTAQGQDGTLRSIGVEISPDEINRMNWAEETIKIDGPLSYLNGFESEPKVKRVCFAFLTSNGPNSRGVQRDLNGFFEPCDKFEAEVPSRYSTGTSQNKETNQQRKPN